MHPWFKNVDYSVMISRKVIPPFRPSLLKFHFDTVELAKGELETREKLMGKTGLSQDIKLFKSFYFDKNEDS